MRHVTGGRATRRCGAGEVGPVDCLQLSQRGAAGGPGDGRVERDPRRACGVIAAIAQAASRLDVVRLPSERLSWPSSLRPVISFARAGRLGRYATRHSTHRGISRQALRAARSGPISGLRVRVLGTLSPPNRVGPEIPFQRSDRKAELDRCFVPARTVFTVSQLL